MFIHVDCAEWIQNNKLPVLKGLGFSIFQLLVAQAFLSLWQQNSNESLPLSLHSLLFIDFFFFFFIGGRRTYIFLFFLGGDYGIGQ